MRSLGLLILPLVFITAGLSTAQARENHCDHSKGKARGTIIGAVAGGAGGALVSKDKVAGGVVGAIAGGLLGRVIGDKHDDNKDYEECGEDSESYNRQLDREDARDARQDSRDARRQYEIDQDRASSRYRRSAPRYLCMEVDDGEFGLVHVRSNKIVQYFGSRRAKCLREEARAN